MVIIIALLVYALLTLDVKCEDSFSGFYTPDIDKTSEDFAGAWMVTKDRLLESEYPISQSFSMEGVSFAVTRHKCLNHTICYSTLTRDYFDFMIEHLSSSSNQIKSEYRPYLAHLGDQLNTTVTKLKDYSKRAKRKDNRLDSTLGMVIYSPISVAVHATPEQANIRVLFLKATFYSMYRYFRKIYIYVANAVDATAVRQLDLPQSEIIIVNAPLNHRNITIGLPKLSIGHFIDGIKANNSWYSWVKYVYYTEADQILHMRNTRYLYDMLDSTGGKYALVPHRMQTWVLQQTFPTELQSDWRKIAHIVPKKDLHTEKLSRIEGSCCDNGREKSNNVWLRIGKTGFTFFNSEHQGSCLYSETKRVCPLPHDCQHSIPTYKEYLTEDKRLHKESSFCYEMHTWDHVGKKEGE